MQTRGVRPRPGLQQQPHHLQVTCLGSLVQWSLVLQTALVNITASTQEELQAGDVTSSGSHVEEPVTCPSVDNILHVVTGTVGQIFGQISRQTDSVATPS